MKHKVSVTINGKLREDEVEPRLLLVHYIRDVAGLTGTTPPGAAVGSIRKTIGG